MCVRVVYFLIMPCKFILRRQCVDAGTRGAQGGPYMVAVQLCVPGASGPKGPRALPVVQRVDDYGWANVPARWPASIVVRSSSTSRTPRACTSAPQAQPLPAYCRPGIGQPLAVAERSPLWRPSRRAANGLALCVARPQPHIPSLGEYKASRISPFTIPQSIAFTSPVHHTPTHPSPEPHTPQHQP